MATLFAAPTPQQYANSVKRFMKNVTTAVPSRTKVGHRVAGLTQAGEEFVLEMGWDFVV